MRVMMLVAALVLGVAACGPKGDVIEPSGPPPLPPASGSVIGYLIDAKAQLALRDDQLTKLEHIDSRLAANNGQLDAQLRMIEKPAPGQELSPQQQKAGEQTARYNNAPGVSTVGNGDSAKIHKLREENDAEAIKDALAILDPKQQVTAKRILEDRGIDVPGEGSAQPSRRGQNAPATPSDSGAPLPGMEP